jgi:general secretion pathway protein D
MERTLIKIMTSDKSTTTASSTATPAWSTKMSFLFGLCALLGILLLIFSEVGLAQPAGGFRPGGSAIGNPLNDPYGDDEDFEEFSDEDTAQPVMPRAAGANTVNPSYEQPSTPPSGGRAGGGSMGGISVGGTVDDKPGAEIKRGRKGYSLSGPGTEKGIKSKNEIGALTVDTESGDGIPASKEVITDFNFPDADIMDIAKTLGRLTGKNFILDKEVKGRVTIISNAPITVSDAWRSFLTTLDINGLAIVPSGKFLRIMRQNDAKGKNVRLYSSTRAPNTDALVTKIFKIKYISAKELENVIRTYANMGARIYGFEQTNTLIITDTGSNIDKIAKMIAFLDVEGFDAGIEVIPVKYASAVELQKLIDSLLPGTQANIPGRPGGFPGGGGMGGRAGNFAARRTKQGGFVNTIIPDERTNTLIVHANPKGAEEVRDLVARLDRKLPAAIGGGKVHVVYLQFADAEEMGKTLNNFTQSSKSSGGGLGFPGGPIGGIGMNPNEGSLFEGQIKVSPDKTTNSLVITASPSDFATLQRVVNKLDIPRDQIYVEVVIMEMSMSRGNDFTANVVSGKTGTTISPTTDLFNLITQPATAANQKGLVLRFGTTDTTNYDIPVAGGTTQTVKVPNLAALVKALQTYSSANILATPQLMTMDNEEATFESTDKVPVPQINNAGLGIQTTSYNYMSVPLSIKIKPQLNKISNFIKLGIKAKISDFSSRPSPEAAPATLERNAETSVMVSDSDTVVLGGLVRDKSTETINKVPLLGDIPILGWLFKSRQAQIDKTNLMLFITPRIMRQPENVRANLDRKLKERDEFVEKAFGGEDAHKEARNKIIRSLPDVKSITNYNGKKVLNLEDDDMVEQNSKKAASADAPQTAPESNETLTLPQMDPVPNNLAIPPVIPAQPAPVQPITPSSPPINSAMPAPAAPVVPSNGIDPDPFATPAGGNP